MRDVGILYRALYCQLEAPLTLFCHLIIPFCPLKKHVIIYFIFCSL